MQQQRPKRSQQLSRKAHVRYRMTKQDCVREDCCRARASHPDVNNDVTRLDSQYGDVVDKDDPTS